jgi:hypothetical protein
MSNEELQQKAHELEVEKFAFQKHKAREDRQLEEKKLNLEKQKAKWATIAVFITAFSILGSVAIAALTISETQRLQNRAAETQFALKTADLVLQSDDPQVNANKALRLRELFPDRIPPRWGQGFDWKRYATENDDFKREVVRLLADHPDRRAEIINVYQRLFEDDPTVQRLFGSPCDSECDQGDAKARNSIMYFIGFKIKRRKTRVS